VQAEVDNGCVDVIGGVEGEDVTLGPGEVVLKTLAEGDAMLSDLSAGV
jgi:hypothetical protein